MSWTRGAGASVFAVDVGVVEKEAVGCVVIVGLMNGGEYVLFRGTV